MENLTLFDGKVCKGCRCWRAFSDYYRDSAAADKHRPKCKYCQNADVKRWNQEHRGLRRQRYYANHEKNLAAARVIHARAKSRGYRYKSSKEQRQKWSKSQVHNIKRTKAAWIAKNPGIHAKYTAEYRKRNPEIVRQRGVIYSHNRRAAEKAGGTYTQAEWRTLCDRYGNICLCCREAKPLTVDHVIPIKHNGPNTIENLQPLCRECNNRKKLKHTDYREVFCEPIPQSERLSEESRA